MRLVATVALAVLACSCNGPKSSCEGSMKSWYSMLEDKDWDDGYALLTPAHQKKMKSLEAFSNVMSGVWDPTTGFKLAINQVIESGDLCSASGFLSYTVIVKGDDNVPVTDEYFSWTLHRGADGKWYMEMPGMERMPSY